tara:strand:- start:92 stop:703 length:612 start_codon:yes stop_codon:yes gene_type:complete
MALKLLNPGLRPLGMFDLNDDDAGALAGGEYVELQQDDNTVEAYAADVGQLEDATGIVNFTLKVRAAGALGGLADEGGEEGEGYGTLFGSLIGSNTGNATTQSGAVVIGPSTDRASGKVTVWATAGLYGVTDNNEDEMALANANTAIHADADGTLGTDNASGARVATYVGAMTDSSLVSTTNAAAGLAAETEYHAVFYLGNIN